MMLMIYSQMIYLQMICPTCASLSRPLTSGRRVEMLLLLLLLLRLLLLLLLLLLPVLPLDSWPPSDACCNWSN